MVEKTDRLYRNSKDYLTIDELGVDIHPVKENVILTDDSHDFAFSGLVNCGALRMFLSGRGQESTIRLLSL